MCILFYIALLSLIFGGAGAFILFRKPRLQLFLRGLSLLIVILSLATLVATLTAIPSSRDCGQRNQPHSDVNKSRS